MSPLLTVIVPTYNRPADLIRTVKFLRRSSAFLIIIADGSDSEYSSQNARCRELGENIAYFHIPRAPAEATATNYRHRVQRAFEQIETPYVAFCGDDDLLVPESAMKAAEFLENNPRYVCCHGIYLQFKCVQDTIEIPNIEYQGESIDADEVSGRLMQLFSRYEAPYYAVFRVPVLRLLFERCKDILSPLWNEMYHSTGAAIAGKIHRSNTIYCLRNIGNPPHYKAGSSFINFGQWIAADLDGFLMHYVGYRDQVLEWAAPGADRDTVHRVLDMAFITYIGSEFNLSFWIDSCCETAKDESARDKLRARLNQNLRRPVDRAAVPSLRGGTQPTLQI
jgi:glycosyltransferase domain-containing protein